MNFQLVFEAEHSCALKGKINKIFKENSREISPHVARNIPGSVLQNMFGNLHSKVEFLAANVAFIHVASFRPFMLEDHVHVKFGSTAEVHAAVETEDNLQGTVHRLLVLVEINEVLVMLRADNAAKLQIIVVTDGVIQKPCVISRHRLALKTSSSIIFSSMRSHKMFVHFNDIDIDFITLAALPKIFRPQSGIFFKIFHHFWWFEENSFVDFVGEDIQH